MTVIDRLTARPIIQSHKGTLDYYYWRGLYVVRQWPRPRSTPLSTRQAASAAAFAAYSRALITLAPELLAAAQTLTTNTAWTWKDATTTAAYGHLYTRP